MESPKTLVADIGGTGSRLALMVDGYQVGEVSEYVNANFDSFEAVLEEFLDAGTGFPDVCALSVAGPVDNGDVQMTNLPWRISARQLQARFGFGQVHVINDFAAVAWATLALDTTGLLQVGGGSPRPLANRVALGPGTGLGVAALVHSDGDWSVVAGEGGHVSLPACTAEESDLVMRVIRQYGHCSAERLLSGPGLVTIASELGYGQTRPEALALRAQQRDANALHVFKVFSELLATVAADLALTFDATGGVYLGGGILPRTLAWFDTSDFRRRFENKGRYGKYLAGIPTYVITVPNPSFVGLGQYLRRMQN